jgi:hypothetical protein
VQDLKAERGVVRAGSDDNSGFGQQSITHPRLILLSPRGTLLAPIGVGIPTDVLVLLL